MYVLDTIMSMKIISLINADDVQAKLAQYIKQQRKLHKYSRKALAKRSGVPASTLKKFENTTQISLRQFLLLWQSVDHLDKLVLLTKDNGIKPKSIDEVLSYD